MMPRVFHSADLPYGPWRHEDLFRGHKVLVVGGGLTAAHLVLLAKRYGASSVVMVVRSQHLRVQEYCVDLSWVGQRKHLLLSSYRSQPLHDRLALLKASRPGGSITPTIMSRLLALRDDPREGVRVIQGAEVVEMVGCEGRRGPLSVRLDSGERVGCLDCVILATGREVDVTKDGLLTPLLPGHEDDGPGIATVQGLPVLDSSLRLGGEGEVFVMGAYAALQVGPDAANISGGVKAARLIADAMAGPHVCGCDQEGEAGAGGDDDIHDIHDLHNPFGLLEEEEEEEEEESDDDDDHEEEADDVHVE